LLVLGSVII